MTDLHRHNVHHNFLDRKTMGDGKYNYFSAVFVRTYGKKNVIIKLIGLSYVHKCIIVKVLCNEFL